MSESLKRVKKEVIELSLDADVIEIETAKSSAEAATEIGCNLEEIAKSKTRSFLMALTVSLESHAVAS